MNSKTSGYQIRILTLLILLFSVSFGRAESIFSINGMGELSYPVGGQARGMGGLNIAFLDGRAVSMINPALSGAVDTTTVSGLFLFEQRRIKDSFASTTIHSWSPHFLRLIIPLSHGLVAGGGIAPYSDANFHLSKGADVFGERYTLRVSAEGGTHLGSMTLAKNIGNRLYVGAAANLIFGSISEEWHSDFEDPWFVDSQDHFKTSYYGQEYVGGIALRLHRTLTVGAMYSRSGNIKATEEQTSVSGSVEKADRELDFPDAYGLGFTYRVNRWLLVGADLYTRLWDQFRRDGFQVPEYQNTTRFSFGCEVARSDDKAASFYAKMPWRVGFYHEPGYYEDTAGNRVSNIFFTFGTSLLFKEKRGAIDLAFEFGKRGDVTQNGAQEWIFRQSFTIIGWERWFQPREY